MFSAQGRRNAVEAARARKAKKGPVKRRPAQECARAARNLKDASLPPAPSLLRHKTRCMLMTGGKITAAMSYGRACCPLPAAPRPDGNLSLIRVALLHE